MSANPFTRKFLAVLFSLNAVGCGVFYNEPSVACRGPENVAPVAILGDDLQVQMYSDGDAEVSVIIDGSRSFDPDGDPLAFQWRIVSSTASTGSISGEGAHAQFYVVGPGEVVVELTVEDPCGATSTDQLRVTVSHLLVASITGPDVARRNEEIVFNAHVSPEDDGATFSYTWSVISQPAGAQLDLSGVDGPEVSFSPSVEGEYRIGLVVGDGNRQSSLVTKTVSVQPMVMPLDFNVIDAEYDSTTDSIVMVSADPSTLHIYDPVTGEDTRVGLPIVPTCVSVGPDGRFAAVGHDGWVSLVHLETGNLVKTMPVSTDVVDVVLAGNDYIYAFPRTDQWVSIHSINITSELETIGDDHIHAGTLAKLHPSGKAMYGADNGVSPSDIEKYDISGGPAIVLYDSPYHGDFAMCGDLWMSKDGLRIFTRCSNVFRSSELQSQDMLYNGSFAIPDTENLFIKSVDHSSAISQVALIPEVPVWGDEDADTKVVLFDYDYLDYVGQVQLPGFLHNGLSVASHGRFVFYHSSGDQLFVIVQADETSGFLHDYGIAAF